MTDKAIVDFLKEYNRPFSINDIITNVGNETPKSSVLKSLDKLVNKKAVIEKIYNKQKIYCIAQDDSNSGETEEDPKSLDREINRLNAILASIKENLNETKQALKLFRDDITLEDAKGNHDILSDNVKKLRERLEELEGKTEPISEEERMKVISEYEKYVKEYKKRKKLSMESVDAIMEGYPKTKKDLFEDIGIETDEEAGFTLK